MATQSRERHGVVSAAAKCSGQPLRPPCPQNQHRGHQHCHCGFPSQKCHLVQLRLWLSGMGKGSRLALSAWPYSMRKSTREQGHIFTLTNHPGSWHWEKFLTPRIGFSPGGIRMLKGHSHPGMCWESQCSAQHSSSPSWASALLPTAPTPWKTPHTAPTAHKHQTLTCSSFNSAF